DGVIRLKVKKDTILRDPGCQITTYEYSPVVEVKGVPWKASASLANNCKIDSAIECCLRKSSDWNIDMDVGFILVNSDTSKNITVEDSYNFRFINPPYNPPVSKLKNCSKLIIDNSLIEPENGFINDLTFVIEIRFWITKMKGIRIPELTDFTYPNDP
ncbi:hypothetical protein PMAYCL1PPCAC_25242, partial [Pristionchus mayeri]